MFKQLHTEVRGQALVETALVLPFLLGLVFNVINFGYFFLMALNIAAAPRSGALYSVMGSQTPATPELPLPSAVSTLTTNDLTGAVGGGATAGVQVCTPKSGTTGSGSSLLSVCTQFNSSPTYTPSADPEAPAFVLNQVDVTYTFSPLIDRRLFNLIVLTASSRCTVGGGGAVTCTFHRKIAMRAMS